MAECKDSITNNTNAQKQCLKLEESDLKEEFKTDRGIYLLFLFQKNSLCNLYFL